MTNTPNTPASADALLPYWRLIDTAPVNTNVIVWDARRKMVLLAFYAMGAKMWLDPFDANHEISPTHWHPVPEAPR